MGTGGHRTTVVRITNDTRLTNSEDSAAQPHAERPTNGDAVDVQLCDLLDGPARPVPAGVLRLSVDINAIERRATVVFDVRACCGGQVR